MRTATWLIELSVGVACLAIGAGAMRSDRLRIVGIVAIAAGLAAAGHAILQLTT